MWSKRRSAIFLRHSAVTHGFSNWIPKNVETCHIIYYIWWKIYSTLIYTRINMYIWSICSRAVKDSSALSTICDDLIFRTSFKVRKLTKKVNNSLSLSLSMMKVLYNQLTSAHVDNCTIDYVYRVFLWVARSGALFLYVHVISHLCSANQENIVLLATKSRLDY